jgi:hypothetical protein
MRRLEGTIARGGGEANAPQGSDRLFLFDGYLGYLNYRKDGIALFEIHSLYRTRCDNRGYVSGRRSDDNFRHTLSETIFSIVPGKRFRMLVLVAVSV